MSDSDLIFKFKEIIDTAVEVVCDSERDKVQEILSKYVSVLKDKNIQGIRFEWLSGSMHARGDIVCGNATQTVIFCLHDDNCEFHPK